MTQIVREPLGMITNYQREQIQFAHMKGELRRRKRARWRLWLALRVAGRRRFG